ncbi:glycerophosphoryl diester phosphodiesterase [Wenyingzhuangia heitensis]|uniref:glycerophosphodiester phosphodiesterase n=1 Tax=Wenyingzhuangia heitensis TaxID=1487859 RepID=A0ABX0U5Q8_9FLAO|nr:glycerophosphodiester phosphodiesterase [Wenyingzhuangia heitensis]NIJ44108.1 glycerophosphoryl diester phosphodiesterase [Wenyingzhuangia heitensis]
MKLPIKIHTVYFLILGVLLSCKQPVKKSDMLIIAHRGASGYLPEHTLPAKALAYGMLPDFIEQDVVLSKDNVPVIIHDIHLETTTNVAEVYADRVREDGKFYVIDFTWAELQTLNVSERFNTKTKQAIYKDRFPIHKSHFKLHTLADEIELIQGLNKSMRKDIGVYVEIKEPQFHRNEGKDISKIVLTTLSNYGYSTLKDNCILQCFDAVELQKIRKKYNSNLFLVQLFDSEYYEGIHQQMSLEAIVNNIAKYANGIGPSYRELINKKIKISGFENLVDYAHQQNLKVHAFTFRADALGGKSTFNEVFKIAEDLNLDGIFTDHPDQAISYFKKKNH